jgi:hypothetical protein
MAAGDDSSALEEATVAALAAVIAEFTHEWLGPIGEHVDRDANVGAVLDVLVAQAKRRAAQLLDARYLRESRKAG